MSDVSQPVDRSGDGRSTELPAATIEGLFADLVDLREQAETTEVREEVHDIKQLLVEAHDRGLIGSSVRHLRARDVAEAFVGSVIFASPLLVEDGIFDIANHLFDVTVSGVPVFLVANTVFVVFMTYALLEWTGRNRDEVAVLFGVVSLRLVMTLTVSFFVAAMLMTAWGRVGGWQSPIEAIARINVLWTVGSLGAALGDILSDNSPSEEPVPRTDVQYGPGRGAGVSGTIAPPDGAEQWNDSTLVAELYRQFDDLESAVTNDRDRTEVNRLREQTIESTLDDASGDQIQKYTSRDVAEAFVGSIFFAIPFLVEDGVFDIAEFFLSFQIGFFPVYFLFNAAFVLVMILALVYWAGPQNVQITRPIFGFIPRRLIGIAVVSFLTAAALMTMWGRVDNWQDPVVALARISVVWTVTSFGASLGDILPGESSGADINDGLADLGGFDGADKRDESNG